VRAPPDNALDSHNAMVVGDIVRQEIPKRFPHHGHLVLVRLAETELPFLDDPQRERERNRVHLAILKIADGRLPEFENALEQAAIDWRDTLVEAGLGNENWPDVLSSAGYPVP
jgi:hypothetical protein